jgi:ABC-type dipeptide/oligopeptide/nickel transport system permease subunit
MIPRAETRLESKMAYKKRRSASQLAVVWRRFRKNKAAIAGLVLVGFTVFIALYGSLFAPYPPRSFPCLYQGCTSMPPFQSWAHPLGTEPSGIDVYSEILQSARNDLYVGLVSTLIAIAIGLVVGIVSGYASGVSSALLLGVTQVFLVLPVLVLILLFARIFQLLVAQGLGLTLIVLILGFFGWPGVAYIARGEALRLRELEFIQASKALGASGSRILFRHVLPNILSPIIVVGTLSIAGNILTEVVINFLGFGDPNTSTWGQLLNDGLSWINYWWISFFPGLMVVFSVLGFNLLGDGLSDALNPRLRD